MLKAQTTNYKKREKTKCEPDRWTKTWKILGRLWCASARLGSWLSSARQGWQTHQRRGDTAHDCAALAPWRVPQTGAVSLPCLATWSVASDDLRAASCECRATSSPDSEPTTTTTNQHHRPSQLRLSIIPALLRNTSNCTDNSHNNHSPQLRIIAHECLVDDGLTTRLNSPLVHWWVLEFMCRTDPISTTDLLESPVCYQHPIQYSAVVLCILRVCISAQS